ncbi:hypothetical protein [Priestia megaterium]|uniref:hypothetical protein n=1 Tax=Priestia megaterium TaxID=1404 RepID=UPI0012B83C0E|nr:hypothetical protein [Priestia megaterium]
MFVGGILVVVWVMLEREMCVVFSWGGLIGRVRGVFLRIGICNDGDRKWFEGGSVLGGYIIMGIGFYVI